MVIVHLLASPFVGGIERQVLGLAGNLPPDYRTMFLSFAEHGRARPFLELARQSGFEAVTLENNTPHLYRASREVAGHLRKVRAKVLCCHGYKPDIVGWRAARRAGIPVVSISHGWTGADRRARFYESLDRLILRWMDRVVCVSAGQAAKVRRAGVPGGRVRIIRNAIDADAFPSPDPAYGEELRKFLPGECKYIVGSAGRLSPEKGFDQMVAAAELVKDKSIGFVLFGDGPLRESITRHIAARGLQQRFILAGFRSDVRKFLPHWDLAVLPSFTEGLPVMVLEAFAAGVPVVATAVGGTPEIVEEGKNGYLVPPGNPAALARRIVDALNADRAGMGKLGRQRVQQQFTFASQSAAYQELFEEITIRRQR